MENNNSSVSQLPAAQQPPAEQPQEQAQGSSGSGGHPALDHLEFLSCQHDD